MSEVSDMLSAHGERVRPYRHWAPTQYEVDGRYLVAEHGTRYFAWDLHDEAGDLPLGGPVRGGADSVSEKLAEVLTWPAEWRSLPVADLRLAVSAWEESSLRRAAEQEHEGTSGA